MSQNDAPFPGLTASPKAPAYSFHEPLPSPWKTGFTLASEPRWQLAQRIAASRSFARSALLSRFLLYVCEREITGKTAEISEHQIGVQVFGRRADYNAGEDNIVRNYARQLRHRLEQYFLEEGSDEEMRLSIPRGTYVPAYTANHSQPSSLQVAPEPEAQGADPEMAVAARARWSPGWMAAAMVALILLGCVWVGWTRRVSAFDADPTHVLWAGLFDKSRPTLIVPSDDGIVMIQNLTKHLVPLSEYINRDYLSLKGPNAIDVENMRDLDAQRYTNVTDLNAVMRFSKLPEANAGRFAVRFARDLRMEDLKDANVILLGSSFSNPWAELFEKSLNFDFRYQPHPNASVILNRRPQAGELSVYENDATGPSHRTYALIALVPNLDGTGWVLLVEGLTMAGTQAAVDTLFNRGAMRPLLSQVRNADGTLNSFELLIETRSFGSDSPQASVLATRIYKKHG